MVFLVQIPLDEYLKRLTPKYLSVVLRDGFSRVETVGAQVIPIDGKTLRGSYDREQKKSALHLVHGQVSIALFWDK